MLRLFDPPALLFGLPRLEGVYPPPRGVAGSIDIVGYSIGSDAKTSPLASKVFSGAGSIYSSIALTSLEVRTY